MLKSLFAIVLFLMVTSCINFETTTEEDFDLLCQEVYLIAKIGAKKICETSDTAKEKMIVLADLAKPVGDVIDEDGVIQLSNFVSDFNSGVLDEDIQIALELVIIRLKRSGMLKFEEGTQLLTQRSAKLIRFALNGLIDGCNATTAG